MACIICSSISYGTWVREVRCIWWGRAVLVSYACAYAPMSSWICECENEARAPNQIVATLVSTVRLAVCSCHVALQRLFLANCLSNLVPSNNKDNCGKGYSKSHEKTWQNVAKTSGCCCCCDAFTAHDSNSNNSNHNNNNSNKSNDKFIWQCRALWKWVQILSLCAGWGSLSAVCYRTRHTAP